MAKTPFSPAVEDRSGKGRDPICVAFVGQHEWVGLVERTSMGYRFAPKGGDFGTPLSKAELFAVLAEAGDAYDQQKALEDEWTTAEEQAEAMIEDRKHVQDPVEAPEVSAVYGEAVKVEVERTMQRQRRDRSSKRKCGRCAGTGQFVTRVENDRPVGPGGICFRCQGKGYVTQKDERRNWGYDVNQTVSANS